MEFCEKIAVRTNTYAHTPANMKKNRQWHDVTAIELMAFHALWIFMSEYKCKSGLKGYWGDDGHTFAIPFIQETMSHEHFNQIWENLHVVSPSDLPPGADMTNPVLKMKMWYDILNNCVYNMWNPTVYIVLDETCIRLCGCSKMKQVLPLYV